MRAGASTPVGGSVRLVEREAELARIADCLDDALVGQGSMLVVEGAAGIGKSTLLAAAAGAATERRMQVLRARAARTEEGFAFGVVRQLFEPVLHRSPPDVREALFEGAAGAALDVLGHGGSSTAPADGDRLLHGLYWLLAGLCERRPALVAVDDAQWADATSLRFLLYLARRVSELPVVLAAAMRSRDPGAEPTLAATLAADAAGERLDPARLSEAGVRGIVAQVLGGPVDDAFARACAEATGGNPFLVRELLTELARSGVTPVEAHVVRVRGVQPASVVRTVLLRLARLPAGAIELARAVAVLEHAAFDVAVELSGIPREDADAITDALVEADVLSADGELTFVHPMLRDVVYGDLLPRERVRRHAEAARVLRAVGAPAELVAAHLQHTDLPLSAEDVATLRRSADDALQRGSPGIAAAALRRAVVPTAPAPGLDVLVQLGRAELEAGNAPAAVTVLERAVTMATDPVTVADVTSLLVSARLATGDAVTAMRELEAAIDRLGDADRERTLKLEAKLGGFALALGLDATRLERFTGLAGETPGEREVLAALSWTRIPSTEDFDTAIDFARRGFAGGRLFEELESDSALLNLATVLAVAERFDEADLAVRLLKRLARERGSVIATIYAMSNAGLVAAVRGDLRTAIAEMDAAVRLGEEVDWSGTPLLGYYLMQFWVERGAVDEAERVIERVTWRRPFAPSGEPAGVPRATLRLEQGRPDDALADLRAAAAAERGVNLTRYRNWRLPAVRGLLALGEADEARAHAEANLDLARRRGYDRPIGEALHHVALTRSGEEALELLQAAVAHLERVPAARYELAQALLDQGAAIRRAGRPADARQPLGRAVELAEWCGADRLAERADHELAATGMRRRRTRTEADELTPSERRIAAMAIDGLSNKQIAQTLFVTLKTVETHLGHAYRKLGVSSRRELAGVL